MVNINRHYILILHKGLALGLIIALLGIVLASTTVGRWVEEELALSGLFQLRGARPPPDDVVVVSIDRKSSKRLDLPNKPRKWPRALHAELLHNLTANGASMSAFDVIFEDERNASDNLKFARAIAEAGNVVLFQYLKKEPLPDMGMGRSQRNMGILERLISPLPVLKEAAMGLAPFPLPKVPARVNHFILFKSELGNIATLPVLALLVHSLPAYEDLAGMLKRHLPDQAAALPERVEQIRQSRAIQRLASDLRQLFVRHPELASRLLSEIPTTPHTSQLRALITTFSSPDSMYLNFYGGPRSIRTISYYELLAAQKNSTLDLKDKAVFIGFAESFQPDQQDAFYTVFTQQQSGLDVSGVEIAATAFANLLERSTLTVSSGSTDMLILLAWGMLLGILLRLLPGLFVIPASLLLALLYGWIVYGQFAQQHYWLPLGIPLLWQLPLAIMASLLWKYADARRERQNIRQAFGYHLPGKVIDQLAKGVSHITETGQHVHGIVLSTDAEQYTSLSETLQPAQLHELMNKYYATLFTPIRQAGGVISDVVGDAALAIWATAKPDKQQRIKACQAALDIVHAVDSLNQDNQTYALPTRLGLHFGEVVMGHIGAVDHYEYRAVGDIVNTATRIEGLNKQLGTRIIVSAQVIEDLDEFLTRELGRFLLKGKRQPLTLYELVARQDHDEAKMPDQFAIYHTALQAFQCRNWEAAQRGFRQNILVYGDDGPSHYYLQLIQTYAKDLPDQWDGVVELLQK